MEETTFWRLIEKARDAAKGDCEEQFDRLSILLGDFAPKEILDFHKRFLERLREAYCWDLWAAAYVMNGGASDDGFEFFRAWLVGQGEAIYKAALRDPDSLAIIARDTDEPAECEPLLYAPGDAYRRVTGKISPIYGNESEENANEPKGESWSEDDLARRFPKLFAKYG